jgi:ApaG protein
MLSPVEQLSGLRVQVDDVIYMPSLDAPEDKPHPFVYFLTIQNESTQTVTVRARKWVVREKDGEVTVVEGEGVIGQTPEIQPGGRFSYNSYHVVQVDAQVTGAFLAETANGRLVSARIPDFSLKIPDWV